MPLLQAILLLGPTGAGKSPLGDWLEAHGLWGRPCHHFDFGAHLRTTAAAGPCERFSSEDLAFLDRVLTEGALLENESFYLAEKILDGFVAQRGASPDDWLLMNGLPRHVGQARALEARLRVAAVLQLECDARVIFDRLRRNTGGDRAQRTDDDESLVARKLAIYAQRTRPLVEHYRRHGSRLIGIPVGATSRPDEMAAEAERLCGGLAGN